MSYEAKINAVADQMAAQVRDQGGPAKVSALELEILLVFADVGLMAFADEIARNEGIAFENRTPAAVAKMLAAVDTSCRVSGVDQFTARRQWIVGVHGVMTAARGRIEQAGGAS